MSFRFKILTRQSDDEKLWKITCLSSRPSIVRASRLSLHNISHTLAFWQTQTTTNDRRSPKKVSIGKLADRTLPVSIRPGASDMFLCMACTHTHTLFIFNSSQAANTVVRSIVKPGHILTKNLPQSTRSRQRCFLVCRSPDSIACVRGSIHKASMKHECVWVDRGKNKKYRSGHQWSPGPNIENRKITCFVNENQPPLSSPQLVKESWGWGPEHTTWCVNKTQEPYSHQSLNHTHTHTDFASGALLSVLQQLGFWGFRKRGPFPAKMVKIAATSSVKHKTFVIALLARQLGKRRPCHILSLTEAVVQLEVWRGDSSQFPYYISHR